MKPARLTMTWQGEEPMIGQYLATAKGRTAYLILEKIRPKRPEAKYTFKAVCERRSRDEPKREGVVCHLFVWNKR